MVSKTFNRYIWLLNTLLQKGKLTFEEISKLWQESGMGDEKPMPLRTFHQHRKAVDRIIDLRQTDSSFVFPKDFNADKYYANTVGIFMNEELKPQKVRIRVYDRQVDYLRSLPIHRSQKEVLTKHKQYSEFQYKVCLTPELTNELLAMGENVEVLEALELREEIKKRLEACLTHYK